MGVIFKILAVLPVVVVASFRLVIRFAVWLSRWVLWSFILLCVFVGSWHLVSAAGLPFNGIALLVIALIAFAIPIAGDWQADKLGDTSGMLTDFITS